jgi:hypothetical protein
MGCAGAFVWFGCFDAGCGAVGRRPSWSRWRIADVGDEALRFVEPETGLAQGVVVGYGFLMAAGSLADGVQMVELRW